MTWQDRMMTGDQYLIAIHRLGMTQAGSARFLGISERQVRRYVRHEIDVPIATALLLRCMLLHKERPIIPKWRAGAY